MAEYTRERLVAQQFGSQASAYVQSAVHAEGPDLARLVEIVAGHGNAQVLDLGCGGGHVSYTVAPFVRAVIAYDLSPEMLSEVDRQAVSREFRNITTRRGIAEKLPFEDASFDFVFTRFSAHHWHDVHAAIRDIRRVLKPQGIAVFMDVVTSALPQLDTYLQAVELLRDPSHVRDYAVAEWLDAVARAGLLPRNAICRRIRIDFASWVERMKTPQLHIDAIRALQNIATEDVVRHYEIEQDGSFMLDTISLETVR